jgi:hypothetical protein
MYLIGSVIIERAPMVSEVHCTRVGFDEGHLAQILQCAFLAPDIVGAILDGRQPSDLTWRKLTRDLPLNWVEQRKRLGFAALSQRIFSVGASGLARDCMLRHTVSSPGNPPGSCETSAQFSYSRPETGPERKCTAEC